MMGREDCLEAVDLNLNRGNVIGLRNATRSLADFCRLVLNEVGSRHKEYQFIKNLSIEGRYRVLCKLDEDIIRYPKLFIDIDKQRNKTEHIDSYAPSISELQNLLEVARKLNKAIETKKTPKIVKSEKSPQQKFLEELNTVIELFDSLNGYPTWPVGDLVEISGKINEFNFVSEKLEVFETEAIQEARITMRDLLNELKLHLERADIVIDEANAQITYDQLMGK